MGTQANYRQLIVVSAVGGALGGLFPGWGSIGMAAWGATYGGIVGAVAALDGFEQARQLA